MKLSSVDIELQGNTLVIERWNPQRTKRGCAEIVLNDAASQASAKTALGLLEARP